MNFYKLVKIGQRVVDKGVSCENKKISRIES